jgi:hypothetical protein
MFFCFCLIAVEFARSPMRSLDRKPLNMGIAEDKRRQLAPTVGTMGSGSTDSPAPSPTNSKIDIDPAIDSAIGIAVPIDADTNSKIDIDPAIDSAVGIAVPIDTDTNAKIDIDPAIDSAVGITVPIYTDASAEISINTTTSSATELVPAATIVGPTSGMMGAILEVSTWPSGCSASTWMTTESPN